MLLLFPPSTMEGKICGIWMFLGNLQNVLRGKWWFFDSQTLVVYAPFVYRLNREYSSSPCNQMQSGWGFSMDGCRLWFVRVEQSPLATRTYWLDNTWNGNCDNIWSIHHLHKIDETLPHCLRRALLPVTMVLRALQNFFSFLFKVKVSSSRKIRWHRLTSQENKKHWT